MIKKLVLILALVLAYSFNASAQETLSTDIDNSIAIPEQTAAEIKKPYNDSINRTAGSYQKEEKLELVRAVKGLKLNKQDTILTRPTVDVNDTENFKTYLKGNLGNKTVEATGNAARPKTIVVKKEVKKEVKAVAPVANNVKVSTEKKTFRRSFSR